MKSLITRKFKGPDMDAITMTPESSDFVDTVEEMSRSNLSRCLRKRHANGGLCPTSVLSKDLFQVLFRGADGFDIVVLDQHVQDIGGDEGRQGGSQVNILNSQMQET